MTIGKVALLSALVVLAGFLVVKTFNKILNIEADLVVVDDEIIGM